jgi:hypothetical protein
MLRAVRNRIAWLAQRARLEATASDTNLLRQRGDGPKKSSAATHAKATHLIVVALSKVKRVFAHFACFTDDIFAWEIARNTKRAARASTAIRAMTHAVDAGLAAHRDRCVTAGAGGGVFVVVAGFHAPHYTCGAVLRITR